MPKVIGLLLHLQKHLQGRQSWQFDRGSNFIVNLMISGALSLLDSLLRRVDFHEALLEHDRVNMLKAIQHGRLDSTLHSFGGHLPELAKLSRF